MSGGGSIRLSSALALGPLAMESASLFVLTLDPSSQQRA